MLYRNLCAVAAVILLMAEAGEAKSQTNPAQLIKKVEQLNTKCREGAESAEAIVKVCIEREAVVEDLRAMGWCYGTPEQAEYQKKWQRCADPLSRMLATIPWPEGQVPKWRKVEAENGAVFMVQTNSIRRGSDGAAEVFVYAAQGDRYDPRLMRLFMFDCRGNYQTNDNYRVRHAAPRSAVGAIAAIACDSKR
jgi:hypothetical protein